MPLLLDKLPQKGLQFAGVLLEICFLFAHLLLLNNDLTTTKIRQEDQQKKTPHTTDESALNDGICISPA